jgi:hypothetical protein
MVAAVHQVSRRIDHHCHDGFGQGVGLGKVAGRTLLYSVALNDVLLSPPDQMTGIEMGYTVSPEIRDILVKSFVERFDHITFGKDHNTGEGGASECLSWDMRVIPRISSTVDSGLVVW